MICVGKEPCQTCWLTSTASRLSTDSWKAPCQIQSWPTCFSVLYQRSIKVSIQRESILKNNGLFSLKGLIKDLRIASGSYDDPFENPMMHSGRRGFNSQKRLFDQQQTTSEDSASHGNPKKKNNNFRNDSRGSGNGPFCRTCNEPGHWTNKCTKNMKSGTPSPPQVQHYQQENSRRNPDDEESYAQILAGAPLHFSAMNFEENCLFGTEFECNKLTSKIQPKVSDLDLGKLVFEDDDELETYLANKREQKNTLEDAAVNNKLSNALETLQILPGENLASVNCSQSIPAPV